MKQFAACVLAAIVAGCAAPARAPGPAAGQSPESAPAAGSPRESPAVIAPRSGLDPANFDRSVRPADDLYRFATGGWTSRTEIPADRASWGTIAMLGARSEQDVHALIEELLATPPPAGSNARRIADFYRSFMDTTPSASAGAGAITGLRADIAALRGPADLASWLGRAQRLGYTTGLEGVRVGLDAPIDCFVEADLRDSSRYVGYLSQAGLTLPDRDDYLARGAASRKRRAALRDYATRLLGVAHEPHAVRKAARIVALETRLARAQWSPVRNLDPLATYHRMSLGQLQRLAPGLPWARFFAAAGLPRTAVVVQQPSYFHALGHLARSVPMADWRAWLSFKLLDGYAPALSPSYADLAFDFHARTLLGTPDPPPRWQQAVALLELQMGEAVGQEYVARHFNPEAKARVREMVANLMRAFDASLDELDWMSPATRREAKQKLARITVKVGYPDRWRDWSDVSISPTDLVGNLLRLADSHHARAVARLGGPVDRSEWLITPQTVNAYYYPPANEIVFPAAILQPPFFEPEADDAVNYGAIGAAIGHEISHAFDDRGRKYDGAGNLRDWWTAADAARFEARAAALTAQYSALTVTGGEHVNGRLTLGENIGDLSGLAVAWRAWQIALAGRPAPVLDGFTGPQRFFLGWAQAWRFRIRDAALREWLSVNHHSPPEFRVNAVVRNLDSYYAAFAVQPGDRMYRAPEDRVKIW